MCECLRLDKMALLPLTLFFRPLLFRYVSPNSGDTDGLAVTILEQRAGPVIGNEAVLFGQ